MSKRKFVSLIIVVLMFLAFSAESCSSSLNKASQGLDALSATCTQLADSSAADKFAQAEADQANRSDQPVDQTKSDALAALTKRCANSTNPSYQPYADVQLDIQPPVK